MTIGQWVEIIFMFTLPWFLKTFGMKWVLAVAAWGVIKVTDWTKFWLVPCAGVILSLALFLLFFN